MIVERFIVGPLETNCYLVTCEKTNEAVLIDPGGVSPLLTKAIKEHHISAVILTHGHFDHIAGVKAVIEETGARFFIHANDAPMLADPDLNGSYFIGMHVITPEPSGFLDDNRTILLGESSLKILHTPGHTRGGVSFTADDNFVISGDTLFKLSVGRWDLPGGDYQTLLKTLKDIFSIMSDNTVVYPGHGHITSIGFEKQHNHFMQNM